MSKSAGYILFEQDARIANDATIHLSVVQAATDNNRFPFYETHGTVIYDDGEKYMLEPVYLSQQGYYTWQNGYIYMLKPRSNRFRWLEDHKFDIKKRKMVSNDMNWVQRNEITGNVTTDNSSMVFNEVDELKNGNKLLKRYAWNDDSGYDGYYYLLNKKREVHFISWCTLTTPNEYVPIYGVTRDGKNIYFYWTDAKGIIRTSEVFDISGDKPIKISGESALYHSKIRSLIRKNVNNKTLT